jgi:hypothetical protein
MLVYNRYLKGRIGWAVILKSKQLAVWDWKLGTVGIQHSIFRV